MKHRKPIIVTKRDGTLERFSGSKLRNCLARAIGGCSYDARLAEPLVRAVAMHLRECCASRPPTTNYIHRCVCSVLKQTGLSDVADDLTLHRRLRTLKRRRIRLVETEDASGGQAWRKATVVEILENQYGLRHAVCRFLAGQIESQLFALNYRLIRQSFLAELVHNEVLAWGLADENILHRGIERQDTTVVRVHPPEQEN